MATSFVRGLGRRRRARSDAPHPAEAILEMFEDFQLANCERGLKTITEADEEFSLVAMGVRVMAQTGNYQVPRHIVFAGSPPRLEAINYLPFCNCQVLTRG